MAENGAHWSERLPGLALFIARVYIGQFFLQTGFTKGWPNPAASHDKDFIILLVVVLIGGAGNYWGIDGWWRRRR